MNSRPPQGHDTTKSELSWNDRQCLWWLLEQHLWTCSDLVRFGNYTGVLSEIDRSVLLTMLNKCENIVKGERRKHALSKKVKGSVLSAADCEADDMDTEL